MERVPKDYHPARTEPRCTGSRGYAGWDALNAIGAVVIGYANRSTSSFDPTINMRIQSGADASLPGGILAAALYAASAATGLVWAGTCIDARKKRDDLTMPIGETSPSVTDAGVSIDAPPPSVETTEGDSPEATELKRERAARRQRALADAGIDAP